jgi:hypothetical protein
MVKLCVKISERDSKYGCSSLFLKLLFPLVYSNCSKLLNKAVRDAAKIMNLKYKEILTELLDQRGYWPIEVRDVQKMVDKFIGELEDLENMSKDARKVRI